MKSINEFASNEALWCDTTAELCDALGIETHWSDERCIELLSEWVYDQTPAGVHVERAFCGLMLYACIEGGSWEGHEIITWPISTQEFAEAAVGLDDAANWEWALCHKCPDCWDKAWYNDEHCETCENYRTII